MPTQLCVIYGIFLPRALTYRVYHSSRLIACACRSASWQAMIRSAFMVPITGWISAKTTYVGRRADVDFARFPSPRVQLGGYAKVDATADVRVLEGRGAAPAPALTMRVDNALDRGFEPVKRYAAPGRTVLVGARIGTP